MRVSFAGKLMSGSAQQRRRSTKRLLLALLVVTLVGSQFAAQIHALTTKHQICSTHGDLIDSQQPRAAGLESSPAENTVSPAQPDRANHDHHCLLVRSTGKSASTRTVYVRSTGDATALLPSRGQAPRPELQIPILLTAPKTSPPVA
ncbi:MAG: hypothetical protein L0Z53_10105 [Acidobacteriales bacterium]|nr:hypothetical protein [Terriglobales bacterium]